MNRLPASYSARCNKCGGLVTLRNSALTVHEIAMESFEGFVSDRHLMPVPASEGYPGCEGSPSRINLVQNDSKWAAAYAMVYNA